MSKVTIEPAPEIGEDYYQILIENKNGIIRQMYISRAELQELHDILARDYMTS